MPPPERWFIMFEIRTDLAEEMRDKAMSAEAKASSGEVDGVLYRETKKGEVKISTIDIVNENGERKLGKPCGKYVTISYPTAAGLGYTELTELCDILAEQIRDICGKVSSALICGLGNRALAADAVGVLAAEKVLVTHHIKENDADFFAKSGFFDLAALSPGVMAKTGMEAAALVKSAVKDLHPDVVVVVDSLAAREAARLARTIQLSDTGISPGSGVGNRRASFDRAYIGVPVIAIGVPTVVDTATLVYDALAGRETDASLLQKLSGLFVSPKEIDIIVQNVGTIIGYAINRAFHGNFSYEEMAMMA